MNVHVRFSKLGPVLPTVHLRRVVSVDVEPVLVGERLVLSLLHHEYSHLSWESGQVPERFCHLFQCPSAQSSSWLDRWAIQIYAKVVNPPCTEPSEINARLLGVVTRFGEDVEYRFLHRHIDYTWAETVEGIQYAVSEGCV